MIAVLLNTPEDSLLIKIDTGTKTICLRAESLAKKLKWTTKLKQSQNSLLYDQANFTAINEMESQLNGSGLRDGFQEISPEIQNLIISSKQTDIVRNQLEYIKNLQGFLVNDVTDLSKILENSDFCHKDLRKKIEEAHRQFNQSLNELTKELSHEQNQLDKVNQQIRKKYYWIEENTQTTPSPNQNIYQYFDQDDQQTIFESANNNSHLWDDTSILQDKPTPNTYNTNKDNSIDKKELYPIIIEDFNPTKIYQEHSATDPSGGFFLLDPEPAPLSSFVSKIAGLMLKGDFNFSKLIPPAIACYHKTQLQGLASSAEIISAYSKKASTEKDQIERLKLITAGFIANWNTFDSETKGKICLPSFEGEHLEGGFQDGTRFEAKHISGSQSEYQSDGFTGPGDWILVKGPRDLYTLECLSIISSTVVGLTPNTIKGQRNGKNRLTLKDGTTYEFFYPGARIEKAMANPKRWVYTDNPEGCKVHDITNNLTAKLEILEPEDAGWFGKQKTQTVHERNQVKIQIYSKDRIVSQGSANLLSYVQFDGKLYWRFTDLYEKFDYTLEGMNLDQKSSVNLGYIKAIIGKDYKKADELLGVVSNKS